MVASNFKEALINTLHYEGGFSEDANDAGGATMDGITHLEYDAYRRRKGLIPRHIKLITPEERDDIYKTSYWNAIRGDELPLGVDFVVFDAAVNSGPARAIEWLQEAINKCSPHERQLVVDKHLGVVTLDYVDDVDPKRLIEEMVALRLGFMKVARNSQTGRALWPSFGTGWSNRMLGEFDKKTRKREPDGVLPVALNMVDMSPTKAPAVTKPIPPENYGYVPITYSITEFVLMAIMLIVIVAYVAGWK
jgi:lysozyme family protein